MSEVIINANNAFNSVRELLTNDNTHSAALLAIALKVLEPNELLDFEAQSVRLELQERFRVIIPPDNFDKLMSAVAVLTTDRFFTDPASFNDLCNIMSGMPTDIEEFEPPEPLEMAWAVYQARMIDPMDGAKDDLDFSEEVKLYMGAVLAENGYISPPSQLREAILPDYAINNASSFLADASFMPALIENTQLLHSDLEAGMKILIAELEQQLAVVNSVNIQNVL